MSEPQGRATPRVEVRPLRTHAEFHDCVRLQRATWGETFSETVPPTILSVTQRIGGVASGAFDPDGTLLGFVFGMTGVRGGRLVHWSDMLAVRADARDRGIGRLLKEHQRATVAALGVETILWTYDPLVARNAHLNLNVLGAEVEEYVEDMYGESDSELHRGLGTDRFVVAWSTDPARKPPAADTTLTEDDLVRVEIPADIQAVKVRAPEEAARWRAATRSALLTHLARGYRVAGLQRQDDGHCFYLLSPPIRTEI